MAEHRLVRCQRRAVSGGTADGPDRAESGDDCFDPTTEVFPGQAGPCLTGAACSALSRAASLPESFFTWEMRSFFTMDTGMMPK
jgi:hypothetical protein